MRLTTLSDPNLNILSRGFSSMSLPPPILKIDVWLMMLNEEMEKSTSALLLFAIWPLISVITTSLNHHASFSYTHTIEFCVFLGFA